MFAPDLDELEDSGRDGLLVPPDGSDSGPLF